MRRAPRIGGIALIALAAFAVACLDSAQIPWSGGEITSIVPPVGPAGAVVTISGDGFSAVAGDNRVFFGADEAVVVSETPTEVVVTIPTLSATVELTMTVAAVPVVMPGDVPFQFTPMLTTAAVAIPGTDGCTLNSSCRSRSIGLDQANNIYVTARCGGNVGVVTSIDAGTSFGPLVDLGETGNNAAIEGAEDGTAIIAWRNSGNSRLSVTTDHGQTFSPSVDIATNGQVDSVSLVTAGTDYFVASLDTGANQFTLTRSEDGGATWTTPNVIGLPAVYGDLTVDNTTGDLWLASDTPAVHVKQSNDRGETFGAEPNLSDTIQFSDWRAGGGTLYGRGGDQLLSITLPSLAATTMTNVDAGGSCQETLDVDDNGGVVSVHGANAGGIGIQRADAGETALTNPLQLDPDGSEPSVAVTPGGRAVVVVFQKNNALWFALHVF